MKLGVNRDLNKRLTVSFSKGLAPYLAADDQVVLFDAQCKLCHGWTRFLLTYDKAATFKLCSVQSAQGQAILQHLDMPTEQFDTMVLLEGQQVYTKSAAFIRVVQQLPTPWRFLAWSAFIPQQWRDTLYHLIARNRYRLFGKYAQCVVPTAAVKQRFVDAG